MHIRCQPTALVVCLMVFSSGTYASHIAHCLFYGESPKKMEAKNNQYLFDFKIENVMPLNGSYTHCDEFKNSEIRVVLNTHPPISFKPN